MSEASLKPGPVDCFVSVKKEKINELAIKYGFEPDLNIHLFANAMMCAFEVHNRMKEPVALKKLEENHE